MREAIIPQTIRMLQEHLEVLNKLIARLESGQAPLTIVDDKEPKTK
jgi:hypothetical protein